KYFIMCGIAGIYRFDGVNVDGALLERQALSLNHRGPDANGVWNKLHVGLTHVRLSILELSDAGAQPMLSNEGSSVVSFNGEIYNYKDIRNEISYQGNYRGNSDTEVLLNGFSKYGIDILNKLEGMFAFSFYNIDNDELYI